MSFIDKLSQIAENAFEPLYKPMRERNIIELDSASNLRAPPSLINFNYIRETGELPFANMSAKTQQTIDFTANDSFMRTYNNLKDSIAQQVQDHTELSELLEKDQWNKDDRILWEKEVSQIISTQMSNVPGLDKYRTPWSETGFANKNGSKTVYRTKTLNELSQDIDNQTHNVEFDCEQMSIVEGLLLQETENQLLPEGDSQSYKTAANYYIASNYNISENENVFHAVIMSSKTGNIIEATRDSDTFFSYEQHINPNFSFESYVSGVPFIGEHLKILANNITYDEAHEQHKQYIDNKIQAFDKKAFYDLLPAEASEDTPDLIKTYISIKNNILEFNESKATIQQDYETKSIQLQTKIDSLSDKMKNEELTPEAYDNLYDGRDALSYELENLEYDTDYMVTQYNENIEQNHKIFESMLNTQLSASTLYDQINAYMAERQTELQVTTSSTLTAPEKTIAL